MKIPIAEKRPMRITAHGDTRVDEYAWLRDAGDPKAIQYIRDENEFADASMRPTRALQKQLYKEIRGRLKENDMSVPVKDGPYRYYSRTKKGKQYAIHCRKKVRGGREEVLLDENILAKGHTYFALGGAEVSPDHALLAYTVNTTGDEKYTLLIKDLRTGALLRERIACVSDIEWAEDGSHFFYTVEEHPHPPRKAYLHRIGTHSSSDVLVYEETDPQWYVGLDKSGSDAFVFIIAANFNTTEVRLVPAKEPLTMPILFAPRKKEVKYFAEHHKDSFYIMSNERAVNYAIYKTAITTPQKRFWKPWMKHDVKRALNGILAFKDFIVISLRENGSEEIYIHPNGPRGERVRLPENEHTLSLSGDIEYVSKKIRFTYQSFLTPRTVYDYDVFSKRFITRKRQSVPRWKAAGYVSKRIWVKSGNVKVPVTMVHRKGLALNGTAPLLLEAYGAYGICTDPYFSISKLSLLERGWICALAHPRGGGEMGWKWHEDAKLRTKHRTYKDVIAVADHLVAKRFTSRETLALLGGSAGGMMVGAVLNLRPDLVNAAVAYVPAADLLTSSFDESLGGTRLHYDETGDPRKPDIYRYLKKYSPYEGVRPAEYPTLLVRANLNDIRTPYWEAAKWVARLRDRKRGDSRVLFKTEMVAGHFGKSGRYEWIKDRAYDFAFLIRSLATRKRR